MENKKNMSAPKRVDRKELKKDEKIDIKNLSIFKTPQPQKDWEELKLQ